MLSFSLHKYFCYLCYMMHLEYVMIFSAICNLWKCMDVLTDFTVNTYSFNVERNTYFHQCTVLILCVVFGQSCTVL